MKETHVRKKTTASKVRPPEPDGTKLTASRCEMRTPSVKKITTGYSTSMTRNVGRKALFLALERKTKCSVQQE